MIKTCGDCAFKALNTQLPAEDAICRVFGHRVHLSGNACSKGEDNPAVCSICGTQILRENVILEVMDNDEIKVYCPTCYLKESNGIS